MANATAIEKADACNDAPWTYLVYVTEPVNETIFWDLDNWGMDQTVAYVKEDTVPRLALSFAFLGISVVFLICFLIKRLFRCCSLMCCSDSIEEKRSQNDVDTLLYGKMAKGLKIAIFVIMVISAAPLIYGIISANDGFIDDFWVVLDGAKLFTVDLSNSLSTLNQNAARVSGETDCIYATLDPVMLPSISPMLDALASSAASTNSLLADTISSLNDKTIGELDDFRDDYYDTSEAASTYLSYTAIGSFCLFSVVALFLCLFAASNCPAGICWTTFFMLLLAILYFILTGLISCGFIVMGDTCPVAESIIIHNVDGDSRVLMEYYLSLTPPAQSARELLKSADVIDVDEIMQDIVGQGSVLRASIPIQYQTLAVDQCLVSLESLCSVLGVNVDRVMATLSYGKVHTVYATVKNFVCCNLASVALDLWVIWVTFGWLLLILSVIACWILWRLGKIPNVGCCGCVCLKASKVHPSNGSQPPVAGEENGQGQTKGDTPPALSAPSQQTMGDPPQLSAGWNKQQAKGPYGDPQNAPSRQQTGSPKLDATARDPSNTSRQQSTASSAPDRVPSNTGKQQLTGPRAPAQYEGAL